MKAGRAVAPQKKRLASTHSPVQPSHICIVIRNNIYKTYIIYTDRGIGCLWLSIPFWGIGYRARQAARENEARTSEQHERESIRVARLTRELVKSLGEESRAAKWPGSSRWRTRCGSATTRRTTSSWGSLEAWLKAGVGREATPSNTARQQSTAEEEHDKSDEIEISKELFLLVIQD